MPEYKKHLLIPDSHSRPNEDMRRFEWLGELILQEMPDVIIDIGDWYDMESLCSYDRGTKSFEGRRYKADIEAGKEAERLSFGRIVEYNNTRSAQKKKHYNPLIVRTRGNHEQRIHRAIEKQPELDGVIGLNDTLSTLDLNFHNASFLTPCIVDDICYVHYFVGGVLGRPVGSAHLILQKHFMSGSCGHSHTKDWAGGVRGDNVRVQALIGGAFLDPNHNSTFAPPQSEGLWWSGLHIKNGVYKGDYDRSEISIEHLQRRMTGVSNAKIS